jgi:hypothetical protein
MRCSVVQLQAGNRGAVRAASGTPPAHRHVRSLQRGKAMKHGMTGTGRDGVLTYQDVLDEAIEETFPASDPIAPAVENARDPISTRRNPKDWKLTRAQGATTTGGGSKTPPSLDEIYRALRRGEGREHVNDGNVDALIDLARQRGDAVIEILLREWRSPCGDDPQMPSPS